MHSTNTLANKDSKIIFFSAIAIIICSSLLLAIWSLPSTIALRNILLCTGVIASLFQFIFFQKPKCTDSSWAFFSLALFFLWLLIHLIYFSHEPNRQFLELSGLWLRSGLATILGFALGHVLTNPINKLNSQTLRLNLRHFNTEFIEKFGLPIIFLGFSGFAIISFCRYFYEVCFNGALFGINPDMRTNILFQLYHAKTPFTIGSTFLLPLCFILLVRNTANKHNAWLSIAGILGVALSLFTVLFSNTKNGMMLFTIALVFFIINFLINHKWKKGTLISTLSILAIVISFSSYALIKHNKENPMWFSLIPNIVVGADIDNHNLWKNRYKYPSLPLNELGNQVDGSTYERTAWFFAGFRLLKENPLGYGLANHSFGSLALLKWPDFYNPAGNNKGATHSAWLDLALGVGLPGIFLIWLPLFIAWYRSLFQSGIWFSYVSWTAPLLFFSYLTTEANGQHFIEQLFFMSALFCGITFCPKKAIGA